MQYAKIVSALSVSLMLLFAVEAHAQPNGEIKSWGAPGVGRNLVPPPNSGFIAAADGGSFCLGLKEDGTIVAWGSNFFGQCEIPSPNSGFIAIAAGSDHSLALKYNGMIVAWGYNYFGECNVPAPNIGFVAIAGGGHIQLVSRMMVPLSPGEKTVLGSVMFPCQTVTSSPYQRVAIMVLD